MAELHDALKALGPVDFSDVPVDNLGPYLQHHFEAGELICNSVPPPPGGDDFESSNPSHSKPNSASSSKEITASSARPPTPHELHAGLRKGWGKPLKVSAKENPLGISVYKMAGNDRHGAWFARRSVHEGLSVSKFKKAMQREFAESLAVQGGPGEGNIRGIGGDQRLERKKVDGVGQMEVYQLSAQFPGPTTPREFVTLLLTSDNALSEKSTPDGKGNHIPRHYMVVSKPVKHPQAPERNGYIRGQYESVELIREIPLHKKGGNNKAASTTNLPDSSTHESGHRERGHTIGSSEGGKADRQAKDSETEEAELNPVEWIMITRSEPGGGIPRFMVERGTPGTMCSDIVKFLDWACGKDDIPDPDDPEADKEAQDAAAQVNADPSEAPSTNGASAQPQSQSQPATQSVQPPAQGGVISHFTNALEAGLDAYAPTYVSQYAHQYLDQEPGQQPTQQPAAQTEGYDDDSSDTSSFASAEDFHSALDRKFTDQPAPSTDTLGSTPSTPESMTSTKASNHHERELDRLNRRKEKLDHKLAKKREEEEAKLADHRRKDSAELAKAEEKHEKEKRKAEEKHAREMKKLEAKKEKELRKAEDKRRKHADRDMVSRLGRERDEFRNQAEVLKKELDLLREQLGELQRENTLLVGHLGKMSGGEVAMRAVRDEVMQARKRSGSRGSRSSPSRG
ncbi:hypothetical protein H2203_007807 [Taxawa tesnikishii (nom. ined.)]|nr:hypothetical protein H2203_007807 [Dothideales sp. JES 119]